ncbi:MAG TPA: hypothetical protein VK530_17930 [Candidatus Acidoferrum sp.]|nr:hypothetical protein [Candidatus Acidoferrum sp.]
MKTLLALSALCLVLTACSTAIAPNPSPRNTLSSFDVPTGTNAVRSFQTGAMSFREADIRQLFDHYQEITKRTVLRAPNVPGNVKVSFRNEQPLNPIEVLRLLDTVFAQQGITIVYKGDDVVKAVPSAEATRETPPEIGLPAELLPDSDSYMQRTVKLRHITADKAQGMVTPFSRLPNSVIAVKGGKVLILRDYSSNIRRMLSVIERVDVPATATK